MSWKILGIRVLQDPQQLIAIPPQLGKAKEASAPSWRLVRIQLWGPTGTHLMMKLCPSRGAWPEPRRFAGLPTTAQRRHWRGPGTGRDSRLAYLQTASPAPRWCCVTRATDCSICGGEEKTERVQGGWVKAGGNSCLLPSASRVQAAQVSYYRGVGILPEQ